MRSEILLLILIHLLVGSRDELVDRLFCNRIIFCKTMTETQLVRLEMLCIELRDLVIDPLVNKTRILDRALWQDKQEFITTQSA